MRLSLQHAVLPMIPLRRYLRRPPRLRLATPQAHVKLRHQHDHRGPHKEYFQNPSQYPSALPVQTSQNNTALPLQSEIARAQTQDQTQDAEKTARPSVLRRLVRTFLIVDIFLLLGLTTGAVVISWEYIQPPYEKGSEDYEELQEEIEDIIDNARISIFTRSQDWDEGPIVRSAAPSNAARGTNQHLLNDTLSGQQGITYKVFRCRYSPMSLLVFFAGFGVDGWPDVVHGGAIASVMTEAYNLNLQPVLAKKGLTAIPFTESATAHFNYVAPVKPGGVYAVLMTETGWGTATMQIQGSDEWCIVNAAEAVLFDGSSVGALSTEEAASLRSEEEGAVDLAAKEGLLNVIGQFVMVVTSEELTRKDGESPADHHKRLDEWAKDIRGSDAIPEQPKSILPSLPPR